MREPKMRVKFKDGKFKGQVMTINATSFDQRLHEDADTSKAAAEPKAAAAAGEKGKK